MPDIIIRVTGTPTHRDDRTVPGDFLVGVDDGASPDDTYNLALDCFHAHWGISVLEDFEITAYDALSKQALPIPMDDHVQDTTKRASFLGPIDTDFSIP